MFPQQKIALKLAGILITGDLHYQIQQHRYGHALESRLLKSLSAPSSSLKKIAWEGLESAFNKLNTNDKIARMKLVHKYLPVRALLYQRNTEHSNRCMRCGTKRETFEHVFQCHCQRNTTMHKKSLITLQHRLRQLRKHQLIITAVTAILDANHRFKPPQCPTPMLHNRNNLIILRQVFDQQLNLSPDSLIRGLCVRNWVVLQNLATNQSPTHPNLPWLVAFIRAIWDFSLSIWMDRCKHVNENKNDDPNSLTHTEKVLAIRHYLRIPRHHLSKTEKSLHFNISTSLKYVHTKKLTKWIGLLKDEREKTLRQPSMQTTNTQKRFCPITRYFKPTRKRTKISTILNTRHDTNQRDKYPP